ncbi:hypothetical protein HanRHA438_Chr04g0166501 [Helianthus annuus]|nr:hypothetical protein HanRHA438_Chr04g0166501 [Helianthus annuus]
MVGKMKRRNLLRMYKCQGHRQPFHLCLCLLHHHHPHSHLPAFLCLFRRPSRPFPLSFKLDRQKNVKIRISKIRYSPWFYKA